MLDKVAIIGYSGHGFVIADAAISMGLPLSYYCEKRISKLNPFQLEYLGYEEEDNFIGWNQKLRFILGIGDNRIRNKVASKVLSHNKKLPNVIHPNVSISNYLEMGIGNFISRQVSVNALTLIGDFCILNTGCIIEHECQIGNSVHIAPGTVLAGNVEVGDFSYIGANSVIKQGVKIGSNVIVGAGAVMINNIPDNETWVGNPGRRIR